MLKKNVFAEKGFIHILGPNPAIVPGDDKAWDGSVLESCDIYKEKNIYYWFFHAIGKNKKLWPEMYRIGVATASNPLGPWTKYEKNPILDLGPLGSWDDGLVACGCLMKEGSYHVKTGTEKYYMWYSGNSSKNGWQNGGIGLATSSNPLGPWKKYKGNPIIKDFGYLCNVVRVNGKFYMYTEYPIGVTDLGPFALAIAEKPEGPWEKYDGNPVLLPGDWAAWDSSGYSEAKILYHEGFFHTFYSGSEKAKIESIGYAYSYDGLKFIKYSANPIVPLVKTPDASAYSEVQSLIEPPFIYLYHTLRYNSREGEDLGIQVLSFSPYFKLSMRVLNIDSLSPNKTSDLRACCPISLETASNLALTAKCTYKANAKVGLRLHIRTSTDGIDYDNIDLYSYDLNFKANQTVKKTFELCPKAKFIKVIAENLDDSQNINSIKVIATLGK
jgi:hypothetical protein